MLNLIRRGCTVSTTGMEVWDQNNERQMRSISYTWMSVIVPKNLPTHPSGVFQDIKRSTPAI